MNQNIPNFKKWTAILCLLLGAYSVEAAKKSTAKCAMTMVEESWLAQNQLPKPATGLKPFQKKKQIKVERADRAKGWIFGQRIGKLTKANRDYLVEQINNFRLFNSMLSAQYQGLGFLVETLENALMLQAHAMLMGGPGGGKSAVAEKLVSAPMMDAKGKERNLAFKILMHQMVSDIEMRGLLDLESLMSWKAPGDPSDILLNNNTLMMGPRVFIDEIEKAVGKSLQPLNDILAGRVANVGAYTIQARTQSAFAATNLVPAQFVANFNDLGLRSTAEPLLDRFPFKVWAPNYLHRQEDRIQMMATGTANSVFNAFQALQDPRLLLPAMNEKPIIITAPSSLPYVDWTFLGSVAFGCQYFKPDLLHVVDALVDHMHSYYNRISLADESAAAYESRKAMQYPANLMTNRTIYNLAMQTIMINSFWELLNADSSLVDPEAIIGLIESGMPLDRFSTWRASRLLLYGAPGVGGPVVSGASARAANTKLTLEWGNELEEMVGLNQVAHDAETLAFVKSILASREEFSRKYEALMKDQALHGEKLADRLSALRGRRSVSPEKLSMELWMLRARQLSGG